MSDLKKQLIKLGSTNPELRPHIRKILAKVQVANHPMIREAKRNIMKMQEEADEQLLKYARLQQNQQGSSREDTERLKSEFDDVIEELEAVGALLGKAYTILNHG